LQAQDCVCQRGTFVCRRGRHCMFEITPEAVLENLENLVSKNLGSGSVAEAPIQKSKEVS